MAFKKPSPKRPPQTSHLTLHIPPKKFWQKCGDQEDSLPNNKQFCHLKLFEFQLNGMGTITNTQPSRCLSFQAQAPRSSRQAGMRICDLNLPMWKKAYIRPVYIVHASSNVVIPSQGCFFNILHSGWEGHPQWKIPNLQNATLFGCTSDKLVRWISYYQIIIFHRP